jgi:hypothetical protein
MGAITAVAAAQTQKEAVRHDDLLRGGYTSEVGVFVGRFILGFLKAN